MTHDSLVVGRRVLDGPRERVRIKLYSSGGDDDTIRRRNTELCSIAARLLREVHDGDYGFESEVHRFRLIHAGDVLHLVRVWIEPADPRIGGDSAGQTGDRLSEILSRLETAWRDHTKAWGPPDKQSPTGRCVALVGMYFDIAPLRAMMHE